MIAAVVACSIVTTAEAAPTTYQDYDSTGDAFNVTLFQGDGSFADVADGYDRNGDDGSGEATALTDRTQATGAPNETDPTGIPTRSVSLGDGGSIVLRFQDNVVRGNGVTGDNDAGSDIYVFETGANAELVDVQVAAGSPTSACPTTAASYTTVGRTTKDYGGVDIDDNGYGRSSRIFCVRIVDVLSDVYDTPSGYHGAEIDAVGARSTYLEGDLSVSKTASPDSVNTGEEVTYTITGRNLGPGVVNDATVTDSLPANTTLVSATPSQGTCTGTATVTCNFGTLNGGDSATATLVVRPIADAAGTTLSNTATVAHGATDPDTSNNTSDSDPNTAGNQPTTTTVPNRVPAAANDSYSVNTGATLDVSAPGVLGNDTDPDGNPITVGTPRPVSDPSNGTLVLRADGSFTYTPNANFSGEDSFTYRTCDDRPTPACSSAATVTITVNPPNADPVAVDDRASAEEDGDPVAIDVLDNDSDGPDTGETLSIQGVTQPPSGEGTVAVVQGQNGDPDRLRFTPSADFAGQTTFTYTIRDGNGGTATATVTVDVANTNDDPVAVDDQTTTTKGAAVTINVLAGDSDPDGDELSVTDWTQPAHGKVRCNEKGECTYRPDPGFTGVDSFTYTVSDSGGGTRTASVFVWVREPEPSEDEGDPDGDDSPGDRGERPVSDGNGAAIGGRALVPDPTNSGAGGTSAIDGGDSATESASGDEPGTGSPTSPVADEPDDGLSLAHTGLALGALLAIGSGLFIIGLGGRRSLRAEAARRPDRVVEPDAREV